MKNIFSSKTVGFNVLITIIGIVTYAQSVPQFNKYSAILGLVLVIGNLILRIWFTSQPILAKPASQG